MESILRKAESSAKKFFLPTTVFEDLGFRYFGPVDGHNIEEMVEILENIKDYDSPVVLHTITKKGKGLDYAEDDPIKYHGVKEKKKDSAVTKVEAPIYQNVFGEVLCNLAEENKNIVAITAAMREGTGLVEYSSRFPERFYDVGIAEGHAVTFSGGLSTEGKIPVVAIYSTFLQRAFDHIIHDIALQNLPVIFCMDRAGIAGEDGPTHHGALDIAYFRCIQGIVLVAPKNGNEFRDLLYTSLNHSGPVGIRYPKFSSIEFDEVGQANLLPIGSWDVESKGDDLVILAVGPMVYSALKVAEELNTQNISVEVVNCRFIKPMDNGYLKTIVSRGIINVLTIEEGVIDGGFGDGVSSFLVENGFKGNLKRLGLPDSYVQHGSRSQILSHQSLYDSGLSLIHISETTTPY